MQDNQVLPSPYPIYQHLMEPEGGRWWIVGDEWMDHDSSARGYVEGSPLRKEKKSVHFGN